MCENWTGRCLLSTHILDQRTGAEQLELMAIILLSCSFDLLLLSRQAAKCREAVELYFNRVMYTLEVKFNIFLYKRLSLHYLMLQKQSQESCSIIILGLHLLIPFVLITADLPIYFSVLKCEKVCCFESLT
jgi:hypothetical protein